MPLLHLLLGSNIGDRAAWLASAREWIAKEVGHISEASAVYETAAWGKKEQAPFLNQALAVDVHPSLTERHNIAEAARAVLAKTSGIEAVAGRQRTEAWAPRTLDIDLLLWGDAVVDVPGLLIPHPALPERRFALVPLAEIAENEVHPVLGKTIMELLEDCADVLPVKVFSPAAAVGPAVGAGLPGQADADDWNKLSPPEITPGNPSSRLPFSAATTHHSLLFNRLPPRHVAVEGVIGAGKTTLAQRLAAHYGVAPILEAFTENAFLERFYAEPARYALSAELHFLTDRHRQLLEAAAEGAPPLVADYSFVKSRLFAGITLPPQEAELFNRIYAMAEAVLPRPDVLIYLDAPVERLQYSIRQRGRDYEQGIADSYLLQLAAAYEAWLPQSGLPVVWVDTARIDYLSDPGAIDLLVEMVESPLAVGVHTLEL